MTDKDRSSHVETQPKLLKAPEDQQVAETKEHSLEHTVVANLVDHFLGSEGEKVRKTGYAAQAFALRDVISHRLEDKAAGKAFDKEAIIKAAEESELMQKRKALIEARLDKTDLTNMVELNTILVNDPTILTSLHNALLEFQYRRLDDLHVDPDQIKQNMDHIQRVVKYVEYSKTIAEGQNLSPTEIPVGLGVLAAAVHDIEKVVNYSFVMKNDKNTKGATTLLAEHEVMSAILGSEVVVEALKAAGLGKYAESAGKLIGKAILPHGEGEWPERQAIKGKLPATMSLDDNGELYVLLGGLFVKSPSSAEMPIAADELSSDQSDEVVNAIKLCRSTIEAVSAADKMDGLGDLSLIKYHQGNSIPYIFSHHSSAEYAQSFAETLIYNMRNAPNVLGIKYNPNVQETVDRAGLLYSLLADVESHPDLSELSIAAGHDIPDFVPPYTDILGQDAAKSLLITAIEMRERFSQAKRHWDEDTKTASMITDEKIKTQKYIQREKRSMKAKKEYTDKLEKIITDLIAMSPLPLHENALRTKIDTTLSQLDSKFQG